MLRVEVDGAGYEVQLGNLTAGATLYRFADDRSVTVRYRLPGRVDPDVAPGRFWLAQRTTGAVENIQAPWTPQLRSQPGTAAGAVAAPDPDPETGCPLVAATGECSGVSYTIVSFFDSPFIGGTFTSRSNTGPSGSITITFSAPVLSVTVTIYDPTYAGNTVSTVGGGSASFAYSGIPGVNVPDTKTVTGEITQVSLVPADNDYVAYSVSVRIAADLTVNCAPATLVRADTVACTIRLRKVGTGPNEGVVFVDSVSWTTKSKYAPGIYMAKSLDPTDASYRTQTGPDPFCTLAHMDTIATTVRVHERRHWVETRAVVAPLKIQAKFESFVFYPTDQLTNVLAELKSLPSSIVILRPL